jgi:putative transcriptional regulator
MSISYFINLFSIKVQGALNLKNYRLYFYFQTSKAVMPNNQMKLPLAGDLLISEPFLQDENFVRSVVLLCDHQPEGSFGFVINKPSILKLKELIQELDFIDKEVFVGGPVEQNTLHYIYFAESPIEGSVPVGENLWWGGDFDTLIHEIKTEKIDLDMIRFFIGYSGWDEGQLEAELIENTWIICKQKIDRKSFGYTSEELWKNLLKNMGGEFRVLANYPIDPRLN